jgi:hypothetical protein
MGTWDGNQGWLEDRPILEMLVNLTSDGAASLAVSAACPLASHSPDQATAGIFAQKQLKISHRP